MTEWTNLAHRGSEFEALKFLNKLSLGDPKRITMEEVTFRKAGTVLNGQEKRFIVWTCATAKYNLRLLMMRSDHPTWETGTPRSLQFLLKLSQILPIHLVAQRQEVAGWQDDGDVPILPGKRAASTWWRPTVLFLALLTFFRLHCAHHCPVPWTNWEWMGAIKCFRKWFFSFVRSSIPCVPLQIRKGSLFWNFYSYYATVSQQKLKMLLQCKCN